MVGGRQLTSSLCTESSHRATERCSSPAAVIQQLGCCAIPTNRELSDGGGGGGGGGLLLNCRTERGRSEESANFVRRVDAAAAAAAVGAANRQRMTSS